MLSQDIYPLYISVVSTYPLPPLFPCFSRVGITTRLKKAIKKAEIPPRERSEMGHFGVVLIWGARVRGGLIVQRLHNGESQNGVNATSTLQSLS